MTTFKIALILGCVTLAVFTGTPLAAGQPPTRLPTDPGTPALIPAGPKAEELARAAQKRMASTNDAAGNPTVAAPGANPPSNVEGNFLIGPVYASAREMSVVPGVPQGKVQQFDMDSKDTKFYHQGDSGDRERLHWRFRNLH